MAVLACAGHHQQNGEWTRRRAGRRLLQTGAPHGCQARRQRGGAHCRNALERQRCVWWCCPRSISLLTLNYVPTISANSDDPGQQDAKRRRKGVNGPVRSISSFFASPSGRAFCCNASNCRIVSRMQYRHPDRVMRRGGGRSPSYRHPQCDLRAGRKARQKESASSPGIEPGSRPQTSQVTAHQVTGACHDH